MLGRITQQDQNEAILKTKSGAVDKVENNNTTNPFARSDKSMFIDESNISDIAVNLYLKEQDVQKFTKLALSDADDMSADALVMQKVFNEEMSIDDDESLYSILENDKFLEDVGF